MHFPLNFLFNLGLLLAYKTYSKMGLNAIFWLRGDFICKAWVGWRVEVGGGGGG